MISEMSKPELKSHKVSHETGYASAAWGKLVLNRLTKVFEKRENLSQL